MFLTPPLSFHANLVFMMGWVLMWGCMLTWNQNTHTLPYVHFWAMSHKTPTLWHESPPPPKCLLYVASCGFVWKWVSLNWNSCLFGLSFMLTFKEHAHYLISIVANIWTMCSRLPYCIPIGTIPRICLMLVEGWRVGDGCKFWLHAHSLIPPPPPLPVCSHVLASLLVLNERDVLV